MMTDAWHKLPLHFNTDLLQNDLAALEDNNWTAHINTGVHDGGWSALPLRSVDGRTDNIVVIEHNPDQYQNTVYLEQSLYLKEVLASFRCPLVSARLMALKAGEEIRRHTDNELSFEDGCVRLHIPIRTHADVRFLINDQPVHFGEGECWYMNANYPHQVENNSQYDRVHLVVDCIVNDWLKDLFTHSGYQTIRTEPKYGARGIDDDNIHQVISELEQLNTTTSMELAARLREQLTD